MEIRIRPATRNDIPQLTEFIAVSVRGLSNAYYSPGQIESALVQVFGVDSQLIEDGTYFVAQVGETIVGCGGWSCRQTLFGGDQTKAGTADPLLNPTTDAARIRAFFVSPLWARRGIGRLILDYCEKSASDAGFRRAELMSTLPGEPLYAAFGYHVELEYDLPMAGGLFLPLKKMTKELRSTSTAD